MNKTESRIQQEIVMYFRNKYCLSHHYPKRIIFSVPNERKSNKERLRMIQTGMHAGVSDLIIVDENEVVFIEVKIPTGKQSVNQLEFERNVKSLGYRYILVRSLEEFLEKY